MLGELPYIFMNIDYASHNVYFTTLDIANKDDLLCVFINAKKQIYSYAE